MTGSLFGCRECERRYVLAVWRFAVTVGVTSSVFAAVHVNGTDGIMIPELTGAEYFTLHHEKSHHRENTAQGSVPTSSDSGVHLPKDKETSDDSRMHRSALLTEDPLTLPRCKRNADDRETQGRNKTAGDNKKGEMAIPAGSRAISEVMKPKDSHMEEPHYCPYFNNRAPSAQPNLRNCSWYQARSCCQQREIDIIFLATYPLSAASDECLKQLSFLYCYVCDPAQNTFYSYETLTVCETFCDRIFAACGSATWKGSSMKSVYSSGRDFCLRRSFKVGTVSEGKCFHHEEEAIVTGVGQRTRPSIIVLILVLSLKVHLCW